MVKGRLCEFVCVFPFSFFSAFNLVRISVEKTFRVQYGFENFQAAGSLDLAFRECRCTFGAIQISIFNG